MNKITSKEEIRRSFKVLFDKGGSRVSYFDRNSQESTISPCKRE